MAAADNMANELAATEIPMRGEGSQLAVSSASTMLGQCVVLIAVLLSLAYAAGGSYLLKRQPWMDEIHSWLLITEPDTQRALQALADGVDFNPPTYILLARQLSHLPGGITESRLRWLSLGLMMSAIVAVFILLRRRFSLLDCVAAILMMASSIHLIHQATEIRFYPLWCAACAWLCVTMDVKKDRTTSSLRISNVAAVVLAGIITTTHYFGILSLGLICAGAMLQSGVTRRRRWLIVLVALIGGLCLAGCLPFLIGQRATLSRSTWVSQATFSDSVGFLKALYPVDLLVICGVAFLISSALNKPHPQDSRTIAKRTDKAQTLLPIFLLALMPIIIVLVSWTIQPALVTRYAVTGVLGLAAIFALLMSRCGLRLQILLIVVGGFYMFQSVGVCSHQWREIDEKRDALVHQLSTLPDDGPIIFEDRTISMPVLHSHPELQNRCVLIDFDDNQLSAESRLRAVQRDVGRQIQKWYPSYAMKTLDSLREEDTFYVVPYAESQDASLKWPLEFRLTHVSATVDRYDRIVHERAN